MLYRGQRRRVILSAQGFHAGKTQESETLQAAAFAASYVRISAIKGIDAYIQHRHVDHPQEGGLNLGLRSYGSSRLGSKRRMYSVYQAAGTESQDDAFRFALPVIGIDTWSEILSKDR